MLTQFTDTYMQHHGGDDLTLWDLDKMDETSLKFVPKCQFNNSIGPDDGLVSTRRQAINWTNDGYITDVYIRHTALIR